MRHRCQPRRPIVRGWMDGRPCQQSRTGTQEDDGDEEPNAYRCAGEGRRSTPPHGKIPITMRDGSVLVLLSLQEGSQTGQFLLRPLPCRDLLLTRNLRLSARCFALLIGEQRLPIGLHRP